MPLAGRRSEPEQAPTIVAVATGTPDGGVAVLRISGPEAFSIAAACVRGSVPGDRVLRRRPIGPPRGELADAEGDDAPLEDGLVVGMPGPASFTGEDVVELHVHAGRRNVEQLLGWLVAAGAAPAEAGAFTRRAFERGRLSLDQAEGIAALIGARTDAALAHARRLVAGELRREVVAVRDALHEVRLDLEGAIGFPDDVEEGEARAWAQRVRALGEQVDDWLSRFDAGRRARSRARVVLAGPPNAGKSALFNALVGRRRALVAEVAGTTRDYIEAELEFGPREATLVDTAGLRSTADSIEAAGVALTRDQVEGADLVMWVEAADAGDAEFGAASGAPHRGIGRLTELLDGSGEDAAVLCVESKRDLGTRRESWVGVSVEDAASVASLRSEIASRLGAEAEDGWIGLARHRDRASEARAALREAAQELDGGLERLEIAALPLMEAEARLEEILGSHRLGAVGEDVLRDIFSRFCIGK